MKIVKSYWDELHPWFAFLSKKNLRNIASRIAANKVVMNTEFHNTISIAAENNIVNNEVVDEFNGTVNTVNNQATKETIFNNIKQYHLSLT